MYLERVVVERAASEPGIVVEVVMHRAQARVLQEVGNAGWRSRKMQIMHCLKGEMYLTYDIILYKRCTVKIIVCVINIL